MHPVIDYADKIVRLTNELADLRKRYATATNSSSVARESMIALADRAKEAGLRSRRAAHQSVIAVRKVANSTMAASPNIFEAEIAAEKAAQSAAEATELIYELLVTARTVTASENNVITIQGSIISVLIALRSAEVATPATKRSHSVTAFAESIPLTY